MVKRTTLFGDLFRDSPLEKYAKYFYYGFKGEEWESSQIGTLNEGLWPNNDTIKALNKVEKLYAENKFKFIFLDENKPDVNIMLMKQDKPSKLVLLAAGGAFASVATAIESLPVGMRLYDKGYSVALLTYSVGKEAALQGPYNDLLTAIRYLKKNGKRWGIDMKNFILGGFSAGAHVVARYGTNDVGYVMQDLPKPGLMFLAYPVITMGDYANSLCKEKVIGKNPTKKLINNYSIENHVFSGFPTTYIWQCKNDRDVPVQNSKLLVDALLDNNVTYVYKTYDSKEHGWGIATGKPAEGWVDDMEKFYRSLKY